MIILLSLSSFTREDRLFYVYGIYREYALYKFLTKGAREMKKYGSLLLIVLLSVFALVGCGDETSKEKVSNKIEESTSETSDYPRTFTDGRGVEVTIEEKPSRIVSTTLAIDEYL